MVDMPSHDEIEAMRGGGWVPDLFVDEMHTARDRHDAAMERFARLLDAPIGSDATVTIPRAAS